MTDTQPSGAESALDLDKLEALARAATPGPWEATHQTDDELSFAGYFIEAAGKTISDDGTAPDSNDAQFIAAANPAAVLDLIALARRATAPHAAAQPVEPVGGALVASDDIEQRTERIRLAHTNPADRSRTHLIRDVQHLLAHIALLKPAAPATGALVAKAEPMNERQERAVKCMDAWAIAEGLPTYSSMYAPTGSAAAPAEQTQAARDVLAERRRQVEQEGWTPAHDDEYDEGELSLAAACYALQNDSAGSEPPELWPWPRKWWKASDERRNLVKAGALILADIERLDRATKQPTTPGEKS